MPPPPDGTQALIDAQLAEALLILRDFRIIVHSPQTDVEQCCHVTQCVGTLMNASATLAKVARDLQFGLADDQRYRMIVEHRGAEGRGPAKPENE